VSEPYWVPLSGVPAVGPVPAARVYRSALAGIPSGGALNILNFDSERFDTDNIHDVATNSSRLTCRTAGKYLIGGHLTWNPSAGGSNRAIGFQVNGSILIAQQSEYPQGGSVGVRQSLGAFYDLAVGDYVEMWCQQDSGGSLNAIIEANQSIEFWMIRADTLFGALAPVGGSSAPLVTSLPASPVDGQECILCDSLSAPTYQWHLKYVAAKASNKWVFIGGPPKIVVVATAEATSSATYAALATAGPSFTIPVAGDYIITVGSLINPGATVGSIHSYDIGATGAVDANGAQWTGNTSWLGTPMKTNFHPGLAAGTAIVSKYRNQTAAAATYSGRTLTVQPVAVGG